MLNNLKIVLIVVITSHSILYLGNSQETFISSQNVDSKFCCGQQQQNCTAQESYSQCHKDGVNCIINDGSHQKDVIDAKERCNGIQNCVDGSDESNCDTCTGPSFHCSNHSLCIHIDKRCNYGVTDCPDNEDEANCSLSWISYPSPHYARARVLTSPLLLIDPDRITNWVWSSNGRKVLNGVEGAHEEAGEKVYIGRYEGDNGIEVGVVVSNEGGLVVSQGGKKEVRRHYDVLVAERKQFQCQNGHNIFIKDLCNCVNDCGNLQDELNCSYDGTNKFPCNNGLLQPSSVVRFKFNNNVTETYVRWDRCESNSLMDENILSVDTDGKCLRFYKHAKCLGESIAVYPKSQFPDFNSLQRLPDDFGGKVLSIGPCFNNEFDRSIFEWNGTNIKKFYKIPFYQRNDQQQIHFVPDRVFSTMWTANVTGDKFQFKLGHRERVEFVSGLFDATDVAPLGRFFTRMNQQKQEEYYNRMDVTEGDQMGFYFTNKFLVPEMWWPILIFPATKTMVSQMLDLEQQVSYFLNDGGDFKVGVEISSIYNDLNSTRPIGLVYTVKIPILGPMVDSHNYLNNLHLQSSKPTIENQTEDNKNHGSSMGGFGPGGTASAVGAGVLLIIIIIGIICWLRMRRKLHVFGKLTLEEVENFLHGKAAVDPNDLNGSVYAQPFSSEFQIARSDLILDEREILGLGHYVIVYLGTLQREIRYVLESCEGNVQMGELKVAVKTLKQHAQMSHFRALLSEVKIMAFIGYHENIIQFYGACTENIREREILVAVEYCEKGDLLQHLKQLRDFGPSTYLEIEESSNSPTVFESTVEATANSEISVVSQLLDFSKQIAEAMAYLSSKRIIHGDLACRNILLTRHGVVKVSDFGLSRQLFHYANYVKKQKVPLPWKHMAYESLKFMEFSIESDCWSYGVTLFEIFSLGGVPYPQFRWNDSFMEQIAAGYRIPKPDLATHQIYQIMLDCWSLAKQQRPTFSDIVQRLENLHVQ